MQIGRLRGIKFSYSTGDTSFRGEQEQPEIPIGEEEVVVGWWGLVHCTVGQHFMRSFIWYEFNKLAANLYAPGVITGRTAGHCELRHRLNAPLLASRSALILSENVNYRLKRRRVVEWGGGGGREWWKMESWRRNICPASQIKEKKRRWRIWKMIEYKFGPFYCLMWDKRQESKLPWIPRFTLMHYNLGLAEGQHVVDIFVFQHLFVYMVIV